MDTTPWPAWYLCTVSQQELFIDCLSTPPSIAERTNVFEADVRWIFEKATGLDVHEYIDSAFFRLGWKGSCAERNRAHARCLSQLLAEFASNEAFATLISERGDGQKLTLDAFLNRILKRSEKRSIKVINTYGDQF